MYAGLAESQNPAADGDDVLYIMRQGFREALPLIT